jgi:hypothetical protein
MSSPHGATWRSGYATVCKTKSTKLTRFKKPLRHSHFLYSFMMVFLELWGYLWGPLHRVGTTNKRPPKRRLFLF